MIKKIESVCASERERVRERMESEKKMESVFVRVRERKWRMGKKTCRVLCVRERDREE